MLRNIRISIRLSLGTAIMLALVIAIIIPTVLNLLSNITQRAESRQLEDLHNALQASIDQTAEQALRITTAATSGVGISEAFANRDRALLQQLTQPVFEALQETYNIRQFQFHQPPATSYLRLHQLDKYDDDLSSFRLTVLEANQQQHAQSGLESGVAGIGLRGVIPVYHQQRHIGSAEVGLSFGQDFFNTFTERFGAQAALHIPADSGFNTFATTIENNTSLSQTQLNQVMQGQVYTSKVDRGEQSWAVMARPIMDFSGKPLGVVELMIDRTEYVQGYQQALIRIVVIGIVSVLLGLLMATLLARSIIKPLKTTADSLRNIAAGDGDLTARLDETGRDELADLASSFNHFVEHIHSLIKQVGAATVQLSAAAEELSASSTDTSQQAKKVQSETLQVATAMNEMTATVTEVADNADQTSHAAGAANELALSGKQKLVNTQQSIQGLASDIEAAAQIINHLSNDSREISKILDVIRDISDQTNLLALNAAIEAARAGEQGRGFAVVADEVRSLASRTQNSTVDIQHMIERLQSGAEKAVNSMELSRSKATTSVTSCNDTNEALSSIAGAIETINSMNIQIAEAARQQSQVADEINHNISFITDAAEMTSSSTDQVNTAADELAKLASDLQGRIGRFKV
ncbi:chemotaxis protein [Nitrincola sp. A-D6]|uniref:methyl-accepting chemotaxis protein n=1 Tax=Nitrincola sp. A-D6 TaxID=1545442 RepID=UPI00051FC9EB|nr:methyl-accepting chemotaxis protein [Nitrincola sp. A-D6]KGK40986.1 chemotaxis protein [Nitrincola sp. A-D6]